MRPIKLVMTAFGPYPSRTEVDFEKLGREGLYLIAGDTGAGKTTIFDGISYALFGETSGNVRSPEQMRCTYADPHTETSVELTFEYGGKTYFIRRKPKQTLAKQRGTGNRESSAEAEFTRPGLPLLTKVSEVNRAVTDLLGIDAAQYSSIAMIAQGDFQKVIIAKTPERQELFRKIFGTQIYAAFRERIKDKLGEAEEKYGKLVSLKDESIRRVKCPESSDRSGDLETAQRGELPENEIVPLIEVLISEDEKASAEYGKKEEMLTASMETAKRGIDNGKEYRKCLEGLENLKRSAQASEEKCGKLLENRETCRARQGEAESVSAEAAVLEKSFEDYEALDDTAKRVKNGIKVLSALEEEIKRSSGQKTVFTDKLEKEKQELPGLADAEKKKAEADSELLLKEKELRELEGLIQEAGLLPAEEAEAQRLQKEYGIAQEKADRLSEESQRLTKAFYDAQAGIMAKDLTEGIPCPVCGSVHHPKKADLESAAPTQAAVEKAGKNYQQAQKEAGDKSRLAGGKAGAVREKKAGLLVRSRIYSADITEDNVQEKLGEVLVSLRRRQKELTDISAAEERRVARKTALEKEIPDLEKEISDFDSVIREKENEKAKLQAEINMLKEKGRELVGKLRFRSKNEAVTECAKLRRTVSMIRSNIEKADKEYSDAMQAMSALAGQIGSETERLKTLENADIEKLEEELLGLRSALEETKKQERESDLRLNVNREALNSIIRYSEELKEVSEYRTTVGELYQTASGRSGARIDLETYAQISYFDRIIRRANLHFLEMSERHYEFRRRETTDGVRGRAGLELNVMDYYNGRERPVESLSGGEKFIASLSLALGLSEEIQASAGGVKLDAMFIDEGFGSLDEETLSAAVKCLKGLSQTNRLIGIISHVRELDDYIDRKIVVTGGGNSCRGSSIEIIT